FFFQAEDGIRDFHVTGVQTCALPISFSPTPQPLGKLLVYHALALRGPSCRTHLQLVQTGHDIVLALAPAIRGWLRAGRVQAYVEAIAVSLPQPGLVRLALHPPPRDLPGPFLADNEERSEEHT